MDKIKLGSNIRKKRKEKNITLKELADGICSLGKMSNIENGLSEVSEIGLEKICRKLEINKEDIISNIEKVYHDEIKSYFIKVENYIFLGSFSSALNVIEEVESKGPDDVTQIQLNYYKALILYKQKEYRAAVFILNSVILKNATYEIELVTQTKAYNLLGVIYFYNGDIESAKDYFEKAKELSNDKKFKSKLHFNLAVTYAAKGYSSQARIELIKIAKKDLKHSTVLQYLLIILELIDGQLDSALEKMIELRTQIFEDQDRNLFLNSSLFLVYLYEQYPQIIETYIEELDIYIDKWFHDSSLQNVFSKHLMVILLLVLTNSSVQRKARIKAKKYLHLLFELEENFETNEISCLAYYGKAKVLELDGPNSNKEERIHLLKKSTEFIDENIKSWIKGIIYYDIALLESEEGSFYKLAAENFYESLFYKEYNIYKTSLLLPKLFYN